MNHVAVSGNLTRDPELVETASGTSVCRAGIAVNQSVKRGDTWEDVAHFFDVTLFGRRAEIFASKAKKGDFVGIDGRLDFSSWEKDGEKRSKVAIVANEAFGEFQFRKAGDAPAVKPKASAPAASVADDDIPF